MFKVKFFFFKDNGQKKWAKANTLKYNRKNSAAKFSELLSLIGGKFQNQKFGKT